jgi:hypothetical protein
MMAQAQHLPKPSWKKRVVWSIFLIGFIVMVAWNRANNFVVQAADRVGGEELGPHVSALIAALFSFRPAIVALLLIVIIWVVYIFMLPFSNRKVAIEEEVNQNILPRKRIWPLLVSALLVGAIVSRIFWPVTSKEEVRRVSLAEKYNSLNPTTFPSASELTTLKLEARKALLGKKDPPLPPPPPPSIAAQLADIGLLGEKPEIYAWEADLHTDVEWEHRGWNRDRTSWAWFIFLTGLSFVCLIVLYPLFWYYDITIVLDKDIRITKIVPAIVGCVFGAISILVLVTCCRRDFVWISPPTVELDRMVTSDLQGITNAAKLLPRLEFSQKILVEDTDPQGKVYAYYIVAKQDQQSCVIIKRVVD